MLVQADRQGNLQGRFEIDALPQAGRVFYRNGNRARLGRSSLTPNMYQRPRDEGESSESNDDFGSELDSASESEEEADDAIRNQVTSKGLSGVSTLEMFQPSDDSKSISKSSETDSDSQPESFALAADQNELGTASLVDVRTPKPPSEKTLSSSEILKKKLDPFGLFTLSKKNE
jgi:hypothetical protein